MKKRMILKEREENIILMVWYWYVSRKSYYEFLEKEIVNMTIMTKKKLHNFRILSFTKKSVKTYCEQIIIHIFII